MSKNFTRAELRQFITENWQHMLSYAVANNPWAVHNLIHAWHPGAFSKWARGLEKNDQAQERLYAFLVKKAEESKNPEAYARRIAFAVPYNPDTTNEWTKITD